MSPMGTKEARLGNSTCVSMGVYIGGILFNYIRQQNDKWQITKDHKALFIRMWVLFLQWDSVHMTSPTRTRPHQGSQHLLSFFRIVAKWTCPWWPGGQGTETGWRHPNKLRDTEALRSRQWPPEPLTCLNEPNQHHLQGRRTIPAKPSSDDGQPSLHNGKGGERCFKPQSFCAALLCSKRQRRKRRF